MHCGKHSYCHAVICENSRAVLNHRQRPALQYAQELRTSDILHWDNCSTVRLDTAAQFTRKLQRSSPGNCSAVRPETAAQFARKLQRSSPWNCTGGLRLLFGTAVQVSVMSSTA
ncbi:hypothetical protein GGX14DRAFT_404119 [Mycena pura]|uniref:Uncharacterized protein n=1 Tax=Mycena pura TaxID=153505 RepID=A0AAD6UV97_9AGAR|nr:hypothetical protein GGX14DRAFT_404119 [Mycena pura]